MDRKSKRLDELAIASENPALWTKPAEMQKMNKEKTYLEKSISEWKNLDSGLADIKILLEMAVEADDELTFKEVKAELIVIQALADALELKRVLSGELDHNNTYLSINSGAGGTESCDWAEMLLRMYTRYADKQGYRCEILDVTDGEGAGIKSCTLLISGDYAYGHLKAESGVHRLVRISPFDSNARRHTSFASVFVWAEVDDDIQIEIKMDDVDVETYRSSGAGGQHVNKTDSAVRLRHRPSGIVVASQTQRSQVQNKERALKMLKAALYEKEVEKRNKDKDEMNSVKKANEWGSQIRSYVMHPYQMVKDHRTGFSTSQVSDVMDGYLSDFIMSYLKGLINGFSSLSGKSSGDTKNDAEDDL